MPSRLIIKGAIIKDTLIKDTLIKQARIKRKYFPARLSACLFPRLFMGLFMGLFLGLFFWTIPFISPSYAACTDPARPEGDVIYNKAWGLFQGCTPKGWVALSRPTTAPPDCLNSGEVCPDGTIYVGVYEGGVEPYKLYVAAADAPSPLIWGPSGASGMGGCSDSSDTAPSCSDGMTNTQILKDHTNEYPAAEHCADLSAHGYDAGEWYLPSLKELIFVWENLKEGEAVGIHGFNQNAYWSSTEYLYNNSAAWYQNFINGDLYTAGRSGSREVRCVRR